MSAPIDDSRPAGRLSSLDEIVKRLQAAQQLPLEHSVQPAGVQLRVEFGTNNHPLFVYANGTLAPGHPAYAGAHCAYLVKTQKVAASADLSALLGLIQPDWVPPPLDGAAIVRLQVELMQLIDDASNLTAGGQPLPQQPQPQAAAAAPSLAGADPFAVQQQQDPAAAAPNDAALAWMQAKLVQQLGAIGVIRAAAELPAQKLDVTPAPAAAYDPFAVQQQQDPVPPATNDAMVARMQAMLTQQLGDAGALAAGGQPSAPAAVDHSVMMSRSMQGVPAQQLRAAPQNATARLTRYKEALEPIKRNAELSKKVDTVVGGLAGTMQTLLQPAASFLSSAYVKPSASAAVQQSASADLLASVNALLRNHSSTMSADEIAVMLDLAAVASSDQRPKQDDVQQQSVPLPKMMEQQQQQGQLAGVAAPSPMFAPFLQNTRQLLHAVKGLEYDMGQFLKLLSPMAATTAVYEQRTATASDAIAKDAQTVPATVQEQEASMKAAELSPELANIQKPSEMSETKTASAVPQHQSADEEVEDSVTVANEEAARRKLAQLALEDQQQEQGIVEKNGPEEAEAMKLKIEATLMEAKEEQLTDAKPDNDSMLKERELKIREKALAMKEHVFERTMAEFAITVEEIGDKMKKLEGRVGGIKRRADEINNGDIEKRMNKMAKRLRKAEERIDKNDIVSL